MDAVFQRGREHSAEWRLSQDLSQCAQDSARQEPGHGCRGGWGAANHELPPQDAGAVRVRETPAGSGLGHRLPGRQNHRWVLLWIYFTKL